MWILTSPTGKKEIKQMALIDKEEAAKLIRQNKDTHEDCQGAIHYNIGCEHSAQIVEKMNGPELKELSVEEFVMDIAPQEYPTESLLHMYSEIQKMGCVICIKKNL